MFIHRDAIKWYRDILGEAQKEAKKGLLSKLTADKVVNEFQKMIVFCKDSRLELEKQDNILQRMASKLHEVEAGLERVGYSNNIRIGIQNLEAVFEALENFLHAFLPRLSNFEFCATHKDFIKTGIEQVMGSLNHIEQTSKLCADEMRKLIAKSNDAESLLRARRHEEETFANNVLSWKI